MKLKRLIKALKKQSEICKRASETECQKCMKKQMCVGVIELYTMNDDDFQKLKKELKRIYNLYG